MNNLMDAIILKDVYTEKVSKAKQNYQRNHR